MTFTRSPGTRLAVGDTRPVLIMAGGTGGHIFPGLAVAAVLRTRGVPVAWLGAAGGMEIRMVSAHDGINLHRIVVSGLRGKHWIRHVLAPVMLVRALLASMRVLHRIKPRSVLSMGGYVAGPGGVAACLLGYPLLVHEQNSVAGYTNSRLSAHAQRVLTGFADTLPQAEWVGNPVRASIVALPPPDQRLLQHHGRPQLLVLGGSLGSCALNRMVVAALAQLAPEKRPVVFHQCGAGGVEQTRHAYAKAGVGADVVAFVEDMAAAYADADLVLCRAGALTVAELAVAGLGAVLVPFPHAVDDHQTRNAHALVAIGAAQLIQQRDWHPEGLAGLLAGLLADRAQLCAMAIAARTLARPDAAVVVAQACLEVAR